MRRVLTYFFCIFIAGCSTPAPTPFVPKIEQKVAQSKLLGEKLEAAITVGTVKRKSPKVIDFLNQTSKRIRALDPEAKLWETRVELIDLVDQKRQSFAFPGGALYLSVPNLRKLKYENEIAGMIAYHLAFLKNPQREVNFQDEDLLVTRDQYFLTTNAERAAAIQQAVQWLHQSGYDPRGIINYFKVLTDSLNQQPLSATEAEDLVLEGQRQYARRTPILNPIVRTQAFLEIQKEFNKL